MEQTKRHEFVLKAHKHLSKIWKQEVNTDDDDKQAIKPKDRKGYMTYDNVAMIVPKTKWFRDSLIKVYDVGESTVPELNYYSEKDKIEESVSRYSGSYMVFVMNLVKHYEAVTMKVNKDYPLTIETEDFIFVLAPRVDNE